MVWTKEAYNLLKRHYNHQTSLQWLLPRSSNCLNLVFLPIFILFMLMAFLLLSFLFLLGLFYTYQTIFSNPKLKSWLCHLLHPKPFSLNSLEPAEISKVSATRVLPPAVVDNEEEIDMMFATFDKDGDGVITVNEMYESLKTLGLSTTGNEVETMIKNLDSNGDGVVDIDEFRAIYNSIGGTRGANAFPCDDDEHEVGEDETDMREAFDVFDENKDGQITVEELREVLGSIGIKKGYTVTNLREMISKVDLDGDGMVSYEEFKLMMKNRSGKLF